MSQTQVARLTPRHETILAFVMANPTVKRGEVARLFGVTEAWLSTIIHSDIFQARLSERTDEVFSETLVPLCEKVTALAHKSLDHLLEKVDLMPVDGQFKTAEMALKMAGYGTQNSRNPTAPLVQQNNFFGATPELLKAARDRLGATPVTPIPPSALVIEGEFSE